MRIPDGQNFADIMAFVTVADCMSFAKAAQSLGVEPANLSRTVTRLEKRIGTRLLNRTTRSVSLTSAGIGYYQHCAEIVTCYRRAQDFITGQRADLAGPLRITVPMTFGIVKLGSVSPLPIRRSSSKSSARMSSSTSPNIASMPRSGWKCRAIRC